MRLKKNWGGESLPVVSGHCKPGFHYDLEFVKESGQWKISHLKYTREFSIGASPAMGAPPGGQMPPGGPDAGAPGGK